LVGYVKKIFILKKIKLKCGCKWLVVGGGGGGSRLSNGS